MKKTDRRFVTAQLYHSNPFHLSNTIQLEKFSVWGSSANKCDRPESRTKMRSCRSLIRLLTLDASVIQESVDAKFANANEAMVDHVVGAIQWHTVDIA